MLQDFAFTDGKSKVGPRTFRRLGGTNNMYSVLPIIARSVGSVGSVRCFSYCAIIDRHIFLNFKYE